MFCSANFVTKKNIDVRFQKMLSCLSNISFNIITYSVTRLHATVRFAYIAEQHVPGDMIPPQ